MRPNRSRPARPVPPDRRPAPTAYQPYVVVKFDADVDLPDLPDVPAWLRGKSSIDAWENLETWLPEFRLQHAFAGAGSGELAERVAEAQRRDPTYVPPRFENYLRVAVPPRIDADNLAAAFRRLPGVELAYVEPPPLSPPVDASDDPESGRQGYLNAAADASSPIGAESSIDARSAWVYPGGDGAGQAFVDLERGWLLDHDDLAEHRIEIISGLNEYYTSHGTSVLGIVAARDNQIGCVGIAPAVASVRVVGYCRAVGNYDLVKAIESAIENMVFGDVLLIEVDNDFSGPSAYYYRVPVEIQDAVYEAIRLATALGIVVIEPAGDGEEPLDDVEDALGHRVFDPSNLAEFRDSGAIVVGAASSTAPHVSVGKSCHGQRVDFFAWGEKVFTLADDATTSSKGDYNDDFEATSAASAIIAGAALVVQGLAEQSLEHRLGPWALRALLAEGATELDPAEPLELGVMPNLRAIIAGDTLALAPDVYVRDYVGDDGEAHNAFISASPDVIVTTTAVANPQATWGEGSGTEGVDSLGAAVSAGLDQYVHVRMRNRGGTDATNVEATVYWAEPATLLLPDSWNLVGSTMVPIVPTGDTLTVSDAIVWPAAQVPASGHYCFVVLVDHAKDPAPLPATMTGFTWSEFESYIRLNNNVSWRNFNVVALDAAGEALLAFGIAGAADEEVPWFGLEIEGRLPKGSQLWLELPLKVARQFRDGLFEAEPIEGGQVGRISLVPWGKNRLGEIPLGRKIRHEAKLRLRIPEKVRGRRHAVLARQTFEGREVGRVTWVIEPKR